jgi:hypothetical protein
MLLDDILIYYIKINVEKSVKLDEWKKVLYGGNPYIRILNQKPPSFEKILMV